ncbi:hypothetical protein PLICRDRAFT_171813 [Plicaturopsis crispa FD-325 SS-3]|nr:hypothetical protein PLICRDRAFT_171813 [Plicaturopsis crispa FD-325 SS-3]
MSSARSSRQDHSSRSWWSLSSKNSSSGPKPDHRSVSAEKRSSHNPSLSQKSSGSLKLNSLASAMGLKPSKKHPSLAIEEPPSPLEPMNSSMIDLPIQPVHYQNRPPARSVSTVRSSDDPNEPRTPSDRERLSFPRSLLTLSDADPFAARGMTPPKGYDPNRLSVFSTSSMSDSTPKKSDGNRSSYASSSSLSYSHGADQTAERSSDSRRASPKKSHWSSDAQQRGPLSNHSLTSPSRERVTDMRTLKPSLLPLTKSGSSVTLTDTKRISDPDPSRSPRPPMRARGMTDVGVSRSTPSIPQYAQPSALPYRAAASPPSSVSSPSSLHHAPRVIVRQASNSLIGPPSAPPTQTLPSIPVDNDYASTSTGSSSTTSLTFASHNKETLPNVPNVRLGRFSDYTGVSERDLRNLLVSDQDQQPDGYAPRLGPNVRSLKKAVSQQNLSKRAPMPATSVPATPTIPSQFEVSNGKAPRKQRSFHHPRFPIPPIPLSHRQGQPAQPSEPSSSDARRGSVQSIPGVRKRLFSGSSLRRPSTTSTSPEEDADLHSVFSLPSESEHGGHRSSIFSHESSTGNASFWDEPTPDNAPSSPLMPPQDYMPQHIMSPAELRQMEASFENDGSGPYQSRARPRGLPAVLTSNSVSDPMVSESASRPGQRGSRGLTLRPSRGILRSNSLVGKSQEAPPSRPLRPSTSQASMTPPATPITPSHAGRASPSPKGTFIGLPPPPRSRPRPSTQSSSSSRHSPRDRSSNVPILPLSPPPRRGQRSRTVSERSQDVPHRSIMKKPSFLDIGDDAQKQMDDSFLDLDMRASFDTVHSIDDDDAHR